MQLSARQNSPGRPGFTLIEICIVLMILGILIGAFSPIYRYYLDVRQEKTTERRLAIVTAAIGDFRSLYGRYPCPARTDLVRGVPGYGSEPGAGPPDLRCNIAVPPPPVGVCANGVCVTPTMRDDDFDFVMNVDPLGRTLQVRIGSLPFRILNLSEEDTYDGEGNRFTYAVTESLTSPSLFRDEDGGIHILNPGFGNLVDPAASAHFVIVSHGRNGAGAIGAAGGNMPVPSCPVGFMEGFNCDPVGFGGAVYVAAQRNSDPTSFSYFDDRISYFTMQQLPLWELMSTTVDPHIRTKAAGLLGFGTNLFGTPLVETAHVQGGAGVFDDPDTDLETEGRILTENLCSIDSQNNPYLPPPAAPLTRNPLYKQDCFPSSRIAGQLAQGEGLRCPAGQFMIGIENNAPVCSTEVWLRCPRTVPPALPLVLVGFKADGSLDCAPLPPGPCSQQNIPVCAGSVPSFFTMVPTPGTPGPIAPHLSTFLTPVVGVSRRETWQCNGLVDTDGAGVETGSWRFISGTGVCNCTPGVAGVPPPNPIVTTGCGTGYSGNQTCQKQRFCPAGTVSTVCNRTACVCVPFVQKQDLACPAGLTCPVGWTPPNSACRWQTRNWQCPAATWTAWTPTNNCVCEPQPPKTRTVSCPQGYKGPGYVQTSVFTCPAQPAPPAAAIPGTWGPWLPAIPNPPTAPQCTCEINTETREEDCPNGIPGTFTQTRNWTCPGGAGGAGVWSAWAPVVPWPGPVPPPECPIPPPVVYTWKLPSGGGISATASVGAQAGSACTLIGASGSCFIRLSSGSYMNYNGCVCGGS